MNQINFNAMEVFTVETIGGQITSFEPVREIVPNWIADELKKRFDESGFCFWRSPGYECIIYPTKEAAEKAIEWTIKN